jgi:hypothetical protein
MAAQCRDLPDTVHAPRRTETDLGEVCRYRTGVPQDHVVLALSAGRTRTHVAQCWSPQATGAGT